MKKILLILFVTATVSTNLFAQSEKELEIEAVKNAIITGYVEGIHNEGNLEKIDQFFHPAFDLLGMNDNHVSHLPIYTWKEYVQANLKSGKLPKKEAEMLSYKFPMVDVTGTAAIAVIELYQNDVRIFTDYLSLYKFDEGWKIMAKIYYRHPTEGK